MVRFIGEEAFSPARWVEILKERGIVLSERNLRAKAILYGEFYSIGKTLLLHPNHIDAIISNESNCAKKRMGKMK